MTDTRFQETPPWIAALQVVSVSAIWVFVIGISAWILHLMRLSQRLHDVPSASVAISIVAIPVFLTGASVLTYVFVGLRRGADRQRGEGTRGEKEEKEKGPEAES